MNEKMKASYKDVSPFFEDERNKTACAVQRYRSCNLVRGTAGIFFVEAENETNVTFAAIQETDQLSAE